MNASIRSLRRSEHPDTGPGFVESLEVGSLKVSRDGVTVRCLNALASIYAPRVGDAVLVSHGSAGEAYVVGVLARAPDAPVATLGDGTTVHVEAGSVSIRDAAGRMVFEHRAGERRSVLHAPQGDLEIRADDGDITLKARGAVRVHGGDALELGATRTVSMAVPGDAATGPSGVVLTAGRAAVTAGVLDVRSTRAECTVEEGRVIARTLSTAVETSRVVAGVIDTTVTRAVTRARNVFEEVEELAQVQAGRMRTLVKGSWHVFGKRAVVKAQQDVKINGEKIHLG